MKRTGNQKLGRLAATTALGAVVSLAGVPTMAGNHWLSRANVYTTAGDTIVVTPMNGAALAALPASARSANATFDIVISIEENPQGDDDAKDDPGPLDDAQNLFEERIKEFANAVYESTNGAHKIRRVTIYRGYAQRNLADVQWEQDCANDNGPWAHAGGFQKAGKFIHFCTNWPGAGSMSSPKGSGYTLAHEWGHYAYNVWDEYAANQCEVNLGDLFGLLCPTWQPRSTDVVSDTLMHSQWFAASDTVRAGYSGLSADYLEFSTSDHAPYKTPLGASSTGRNGHERYFGESAWDTLTRDPATDPTYPGLDRTQYTSLTAPSAPNWRVVNGTADALSELDIRWVSDQVAELMIDRSGSMRGSLLVNAKLGAGVLIAQLPPGDSAIGVGSFADSVTQEYPITDIPNPDTGVKTAATAAVNSLVATGQTSLFDGLMAALMQLKDFETSTGSTRESVVYVLSDGGDNASSASEAEVIAAYQAAGVPIVAFGYGTGAPAATLTNLAADTGGLFLQSPTTASEITAALLSANAAFSNNTLILSKTIPTTASSQESTTLPFDSTLQSVTLNVSFTGNAADVSLRLLDPSGSDTGAVFTCSGAASCTANVDSVALASGGAGDYTLEINNAALTDLDIAIIAAGVPKTGQGYDIAVALRGGNQTVYPAPMLIDATVRSVAPISGLKVVATITSPTGTVKELTLADNGQNGDAVADDGTYTGSFHYLTNGTHSISVVAENSDGNGQTTAEGVAVAVREDGGAIVPPPRDVTENFVRSSAAAALVQSVSTDDHGSDPSIPAACTPITTNNTKIIGRIDAERDVDCFFFTPDSTSNSLVARVTALSGGTVPEITVYDASGTNRLLVANLAASENITVGTVITIPATALVTSGHVIAVSHSDGSATEGNYEVSVGPSQISDVRQAEGTPDIPDLPNGGGIGPWSAGILAILALVGIRRRRR